MRYGSRNCNMPNSVCWLRKVSNCGSLANRNSAKIFTGASTFCTAYHARQKPFGQHRPHKALVVSQHIVAVLLGVAPDAGIGIVVQIDVADVQHRRAVRPQEAAKRQEIFSSSSRRMSIYAATSNTMLSL